MSVQRIFENYQKNYKTPNTKFKYTTVVQHQNKVVAFAIDETRAIHYVIMDPQSKEESQEKASDQQESTVAALDVEHFPISPELLDFPKEIIQAGFEIAGTETVSLPESLKGQQNGFGVQAELAFQSTTARLSSQTPFQVISDGPYLYLFRQSIESSHKDKVTTKNGTSVVNRSLLVDRFVMAGTVLKKKSERRFQRSRNKVLPESSKDTLSSSDINGNLFYEPTHEIPLLLKNSNNEEFNEITLTDGIFSVVLMPTSTPRQSRWQIFVYNQVDQKILSFNIKRAADGLFEYDSSQSNFSFALQDQSTPSKVVNRYTSAMRAQLYSQREKSPKGKSLPSDSRVLLMLSTSIPGDSSKITAIDFSTRVDGSLVPCDPVVLLAKQRSLFEKLESLPTEQSKIIRELNGQIPQSSSSKSYADVVKDIQTLQDEITAKEKERSNTNWKTNLEKAVLAKAQQWKLLNSELQNWLKDKKIVLYAYNFWSSNYTETYVVGKLDFAYETDAQGNKKYDKPQWLCSWVGRTLNDEFDTLKNASDEISLTLYVDSNFRGKGVNITRKDDRYWSGGKSWKVKSGGLSLSDVDDDIDETTSSFKITIDPDSTYYQQTFQPIAAKYQKALDDIAKFTPVKDYVETRQNQIVQLRNSYQSTLQKGGTMILEKIKNLMKDSNDDNLTEQKQAEIRALQAVFKSVGGGMKLDPLESININAWGQKNFGAILSVDGNPSNELDCFSTSLSILNDVNGNLIIYYQGSDKRLFSLYYDTIASRVSVPITADSGSSPTIVARYPGIQYKGLKVQVENDSGNDPSLCTVTLFQNDLREVWSKVPRAVKKFEQILNGTSSQSFDSANVSLTTPVSFPVGSEKYDPAKSGSLIVRVINNQADGGIENGTYQGTEDSSVLTNSWVAANRGTALNFDGNQYLGVKMDVSGTQANQFLVAHDTTLEAWVFPKNDGNDDQSLVFSRQSSGSNKQNKSIALSLAKQAPGDSGKSKFEIETDFKGLQYATSGAEIRADQWSHVALAYKQAYGLRFNGSSAFVNLTADQSFNVQQDLSLALNFQMEKKDQLQYLLAKGSMSEVESGSGCPFAIYIDKDNKINFQYQIKSKSKQRLDQIITSVDAIADNAPHQLIVTRKLTSNRPGLLTKDLTQDQIDNLKKTNFEVAMFLDGQSIALETAPTTTNVWKSSGSIPTDVMVNSNPLILGRGQEASEKIFFNGKISALGIWKQQLSKEECEDFDYDDTPDSMATWLFNEGKGSESSDEQKKFKGALSDTEWTESVFLTESHLEVYVNGFKTKKNTKQLTTDFQTSSQFMLGGHLNDSNAVQHGFKGEMVEIKLWKQCRSQENILDNMFRPLFGEETGLVAYYPAQEAYDRFIIDQSQNSSPLNLPFTRKDAPTTVPTLVVSNAPLGRDMPFAKDAVVPISGQYQIQIGANVAASEYLDLQSAPDSNDSLAVMKKCYAYISSSNEWCLVCGFKVDELVKEWVSQTQGDVKLIGFVEGAPPTPCENLTANSPDTQSYEVASSIEFQQAQNTTYSYAYSSANAFTWAMTGTFGTGFNFDASVGLGATTEVSNLDTKVQAVTESNQAFTYSKDTGPGKGSSTTQNMKVDFSGYWEAADADGKSYVMDWPRRYLAKNVGMALVKSKTLDIFALRSKQSNTFVQFMPIPNPDIPEDWNLIPFKINDQYTKQGTLDGMVGIGKWDPDYREKAQALGGTSQKQELSYYKPKEAYEIQQKIIKEESILKSDYDSWEITTFSNQKGTKYQEDDLDLEINQSRRNIVNTYVWTAAGGLMTEENQTMDVYEESEASSSDLTVSGGVDVQFYAKLFGPTGEVNLSPRLGGNWQRVSTKTKNSETSFGLSVDLSGVERDIQIYDGDNRVYTYVDSNNKEYQTVGEIPTGTTIVKTLPKYQPGKVDAYRFMSFYLRPSVDNWKSFSSVIDSNWLKSNDRNAIALRQAIEGGETNPQECWRIFHRVTFVSRIVGSESQKEAQPLSPVESSMAQLNYESSWQLFTVMKPYYEKEKGALGQGKVATDQQKKEWVAKILNNNLPEFSDHAEEIAPMFLNFMGDPLTTA